MYSEFILPEVDNRDSVVIFGCGKNGKMIFDYLRKTNRGQKVLCFADNGTNHRVKRYKGKKMVSPELAKKMSERILWIISSGKYSSQMRQQLQEMHISMEDILQPSDYAIRFMYKNINKYWYDEDRYFVYEHGFKINLKFMIDQIRIFLKADIMNLL